MVESKMNGWPKISLLEVARLTRGTEPGSTSYTDPARGVRFLRVGDVTGKTNNPVFTDSPQILLVNETDLLLTLDGSPGHVTTGHKGAISSGIRRVDPINPSKVSRAWLKYSLMSPAVQETIRRHTAGVTILHASAAVPHIRIPLVPRYEQERIIRILDEAEEIRRLRIDADLRLEQAVPSFFFQLFGDPTTNSKGLPTVRLGDIAKLERGRFIPRPRNDPAYFGGQYPFIQTGDISSSGGLLSQWHQTLNERGKAVSREFPAGTIVFAIVGATIGATAILQVPVYCPDSIIGIQVDQAQALTEYVEFVLRARRPLLLSQAPDAARANLNLEIVRELQIPLAPINDQRVFFKFVLRVRELGEAQSANRRSLDDLFLSLLHRAFLGEL
jgi:restriction endonuclease S subunit